MQLSRRGLLTGLVALVAAPAIVRVESIMAVRASLPGHVSAVGDIIVDVSHQVGHTITCYELPHDLQIGDIITIGDIRSNHAPERLRQFVVTAQANAGNTLFHIYPAILPIHPVLQNRYVTTLAPAMRGDKVQLRHPHMPLVGNPTHSIE